MFEERQESHSGEEKWHFLSQSPFQDKFNNVCPQDRGDGVQGSRSPESVGDFNSQGIKRS